VVISCDDSTIGRLSDVSEYSTHSQDTHEPSFPGKGATCNQGWSSASCAVIRLFGSSVNSLRIRWAPGRSILVCSAASLVHSANSNLPPLVAHLHNVGLHRRVLPRMARSIWESRQLRPIGERIIRERSTAGYNLVELIPIALARQDGFAQVQFSQDTSA
jgi:hypothetical protein